MCSLSVPATDPLFYNISISRLATLFLTSLHSTFRAAIRPDEQARKIGMSGCQENSFKRHEYLAIFMKISK